VAAKQRTESKLNMPFRRFLFSTRAFYWYEKAQPDTGKSKGGMPSLFELFFATLHIHQALREREG